ncbi:hypothetical protein [Mesobacillus subterraneus]|uniref:hypothetical protein n=1 Tax=Mesobacillus subterraneus TaxID=285983 RepID=UPI001CFCF017|nr:hypothetical protein [Mesobacillus subterraneus]
MDNLGLIVFLVGFVGIGVFLILGFISAVRKAGKAKTNFKKAGISLAVSIVGFIIFGIFSDTEPTKEVAGEVKDTATKEVAKKEMTEAEKKEEAEAKAKAEAEAKAKAEAEAKAKEEAEAKAKAEAEQKAKEEAAAKKANAQTIPYAQLKKNPDRHAGEYVKYTGEIVQIMEGDNITNIRLAVTKDSYGYDINDIIFVEYTGYTEYVDGDIITVYGEISGSYSYTSQAGWEITLPGMFADSFE